MVTDDVIRVQPLRINVVVEVEISQIPEDEALELRVEGGRVSHSWCMCEVIHGYGRLCGDRDEDGG